MDFGSGASAAILRSLARAFPSTATGARSLVSFRRSLIFRGAPSGRPSSPLPTGPKIWLPLAFRPHDDGTGWSNWDSRAERSLIAIGRLKPDASLRQAQAEMDTFGAQMATDHPDSHKGWNVKLVPL